jgi:hypothetical protein
MKRMAYSRRIHEINLRNGNIRGIRAAWIDGDSIRSPGGV